jgi:hypothetical protein
VIFWKRLRWTATLAFLALLVLSWMGSEKLSLRASGGGKALREAPEFHH